jgi:hypothetical protein
MPSNSFFMVIPSRAYESSAVIIANNPATSSVRGLSRTARGRDEPAPETAICVGSIEHNDATQGARQNPSAASVMLVTARASPDAYA